VFATGQGRKTDAHSVAPVSSRMAVLRVVVNDEQLALLPLAVPRLSTVIDRAVQGGRLSPSTAKSLSPLLEVWYATAMSEETLPGGNIDGAVLIGDVVHKRASPWTPTVHALLRHLEYADVDGVPRALGFDEQGRQMLTYLPGEVIGDSVSWPAWAYADSTLVQVGQWM
jgi:hypothetical protein